MDDTPPVPPPAPPRKKKKKGDLPPWVAPVVLLVLFGGGAGVWYYLSRPLSGVSNEKLEADVRASLPEGMAKDDAKRWLESKGYALTPLFDPGNQPHGYQTRVRNDTRLNKAEVEFGFLYGTDGKVKSVSFSTLKVTP